MYFIFVCFLVQFCVCCLLWFGWGLVCECIQGMVLCVCEYFFDNFCVFYWQKVCWVLGIGLQSWEMLGWCGLLVIKYLFVCDCKGIVMFFVSIIVYVIFLQLLLFWVFKVSGLWNIQFFIIFQVGIWQMNVVLLIIVVLVMCVVQCFYFVNKLYGWEYVLMLILCMVVGNMINFMVIVCVWWMFLLYLLFGKCMVWDKIMYDFFSVLQFVQICKCLGELFIIWQVVELEWLEEVLQQQEGGCQQLFGCILVLQGWLDDEMLVEVIVFQGDLLWVVIDVVYLQSGQFLLLVDVCVQWWLLLLFLDMFDELLVVVVNLLFEVEQV